MRNSMALVLSVGVAMLAAVPVASGEETAVAPAEVLALREAAWRAWFAGEEPALRSMLPAEFVGIGWSDGPFTSLEESVAGARAFRAAGGRLVHLEFPETRAQRYGDVVILYGRFRVVMFAGGAEQTVTGRLTELFVRRDGRWLHPGWHLDDLGSPRRE